MSTKPQDLVRRPSRSLAVTSLAVLLIAVGVVIAWITIARLNGSRLGSEVTNTLHHVGNTHVTSIWVIIVAVLLGLVGFVLLLSAILPGDEANREILPGAYAGQTAISRRDFADRIKAKTNQIDGVANTKVYYNGHRITVNIQTPVDNTETIQRRAIAAVEAVVAELQPVHKPSVRLNINRTN